MISKLEVVTSALGQALQEVVCGPYSTPLCVSRLVSSWGVWVATIVMVVVTFVVKLACSKGLLWLLNWQRHSKIIVLGILSLILLLGCRAGSSLTSVLYIWLCCCHAWSNLTTNLWNSLVRLPCYNINSSQNLLQKLVGIGWGVLLHALFMFNWLDVNQEYLSRSMTLNT